jgi:3-oxoacyl-[acyl-carrier-protein] synthase-1
MRRVVVTGMGIVSSIGNSTQEVTASLREARSGIVKAERYAELGFRCHVHGAPKIDWESMVDRKAKRFMGAGSAYNYIAMDQAIRDSGLETKDVSNERTGIIMGSGGPSTKAQVWAADTTREKGAKKVGPFEVPKCMSSTASATLATPFHIRGVNYSISSACATSSHCIGNSTELIQWGKQDVMFAGGSEELDWTLSVLFDSMQAMSSGYNDTPEKASRAYDKDRDGFVIAGGAGVLVLEELEHARRVELGFMQRSWATGRPPMATTWLLLRGRARPAAWPFPWLDLTATALKRLTISIPMRPRPWSGT